MTKQQLLIAAAAVVLFAGSVWFLKAPQAEAPAVTQNQGPVMTAQDTSATTTDTAAPTTTVANMQDTSLLPKPTPKPAPAPKPSYTLVTYDGQNFTPHIVSIPKGGTVRFVNVSNNPMWVASGIHPFHAEYPIHTPKDCAGSIFDECAAVGKGGYWDFKFDVDGKWDYHNHKNPINDGIVRVLLPNER